MLFSNALLDTYNLYSFFVRKFPTTFDYWNVEYLRNHQNMVTFIDRHIIATPTWNIKQFQNLVEIFLKFPDTVPPCKKFRGTKILAPFVLRSYGPMILGRTFFFQSLNRGSSDRWRNVGQPCILRVEDSSYDFCSHIVNNVFEIIINWNHIYNLFTWYFNINWDNIYFRLWTNYSNLNMCVYKLQI